MDTVVDLVREKISTLIYIEEKMIVEIAIVITDKIRKL